MRAVRCKSEPTFRRRLLFASALFLTLFLANIYGFSLIAFRELTQVRIHKMLMASLRAVEVPLLPEEPLAPEEVAVPPLPAEECPPRDPQSPVTVVPCLPKPSGPDPGRIAFRSRTQLERVVTNARGDVTWRHYLEITGGPRAGGSATALLPGHREILDTWEIRGRRQPVVALRQPAAPGSGAIREVGIPQEEIDREIAALERKLQTKLWIGAGVAVLILLIAFLYVLRLLSRTRMLEAQAQMDDRLAFVGALAAGLAHEIRNPLNVLSMNLQLLEEEIAARRAHSEETRVYVSALQGEIRRLSNLVNNFLSYARPNQPRFETRDLNQVLRGICQFVRPEFEGRGLSLRQDLSPYLPPVDLDEAQIRQAVLNILMNAAQILKPGGTVVVGSRVGPGGEAIVSIEDDGPGIPAEDRQRIFKVFYSSRGGGTGLGLPIAARILEAHGGTIAVEDGAGRGARFVLSLPRRHAGDVAPARAGGAGEMAASGGS